MATTQVRLQTLTGRSYGLVTVQDYQAPAYAATIAITTGVNSDYTLVNVGQLTGALAFNILATNPLIGDIVKCIFSADGTNRVVTFGANIKSAGTLTVLANKYGTASFIFDGTNWIETGRVLTA